MGENTGHTREDSQIQRWFLGLDQVDERPLLPSEIRTLRRRITRLRMRPLAVAAASVVILFLFFVADGLYHFRHHVGNRHRYRR